VSWLLAHRSGVVGERTPLRPGPDYEQRYIELLASQQPMWEPGTAHGYHAKTFHLLVGEVVRRVSGRSLADVCRHEIGAALGVDVFMSAAQIPDLNAVAWDTGVRVQPTPDADMMTVMASMTSGDAIPAIAFGAQPPEPDRLAGEVVGISAGSAATNARAIASLYGALAGGGSFGGATLVAPSILEQARHRFGSDRDLVLGLELDRNVGFMANDSRRHFGPNLAAFGFDGAGGSSGFADPEAGIGFGYAMSANSYESVTLDSRKMALVRALYTCL